MLLASGHHRIMAAARGALVMMVFGKVIGFFWPRRRSRQQHGVDQSHGRLASKIYSERGGFGF